MKNKNSSTIRKSVGRPQKLNYKIIIMLADAIQHNASISESCRYVGISRSTYYQYLKNDVVKEKIEIAKKNRNKVVFSFCTIF